MIQVKHISKTFQVSRRNAGFSEAFKALFHKQYECIKALDDISFTIADGEMVGYIGPNGAGKSSTIKVLSGILTPDTGSCIINGRVPWKERIEHVKEIGVVFGQRSQLWWDVPGIDSFYLTGRTTNRLYMLLPVAACTFAIPTYFIWRFGERHYKSTGS